MPWQKASRPRSCLTTRLTGTAALNHREVSQAQGSDAHHRTAALGDHPAPAMHPRGPASLSAKTILELVFPSESLANAGACSSPIISDCSPQVMAGSLESQRTAARVPARGEGKPLLGGFDCSRRVAPPTPELGN